MKQMIAVFCGVFGAAALAYDTSFDAVYTAETGYVTLEGNDTGNGANSSFHSAKNWSDKDVPPDYGVPHAGTNYYVKTGKVLYLDYVASAETPTGFAGDSLVVGGQVLMNGAWGTKAVCGPLTMLPDSIFHWINTGNITGGSVHIKGTGTTAGKPVVFRSGRRNETTLRAMNAMMTFSSDADGELSWTLFEGNDIGVTFTVPDDWSNFNGTFRMGRNLTFKTQDGRYRIPGHAVVGTNAMLQLTASSGQSEIGALTIQSNGVLNLSAVNGTQTIKIDNKLELESGALVIPQAFSGNHLLANEFHPVFELSPGAVAEGLPDFAEISAPICGRTQSIINGHEPKVSIFPEMAWVVRDSDGGGKMVGFSYKETVAVTNNMTYAAHGFDSNGTGNKDPARFWSDGHYPQEGKGYYSSYNLVITGVGSPYVFPGDSLMVNGSQFLMYSNSGDITINNLALCGNGRIRLLNKDSTYHLRGTMRVVGNGVSPAYRFLAGDRCTHYIDSDISGDGLLRFTMNSEVNSSSWERSLPRGTFELTGDNSSFGGKMMVDCWQTADSKYDSYFEDEPFAAGSDSNITLRVSTQSNLGGPLTEAAYDALTISNECRLTLLSTAEFNEQTRGWFFPENAYLRVAEGAVATVTSPITYGTKLVKEGAGTLMLGGTAAVSPDIVGRPRLEVGEGALGFVSVSAIRGIDVFFAENTTLRLMAKPTDPAMANQGVDLTDASLSCDSTIPVSFDMADVDVENGERVSIAICTVPSAQVQAYNDAFSFSELPRKYEAKIEWLSNPADSTKTLVVTIGKPSGFVLVVR